MKMYVHILLHDLWRMHALTPRLGNLSLLADCPVFKTVLPALFATGYLRVWGQMGEGLS